MSNEMELNGQQAGQPVSPDAKPSDIGQDAMNQPSVSNYVTKEQLDAAKAEWLELSRSNAQSLVDKRTNAINQRIEALKAVGITATPEQAAKLIESEVGQLPSDPKPEAKQAKDTGQIDDEKVSWITAAKGNPDDPYWGQVYQVSKAFGGMTITPDDPEIDLVAKEFHDGESFVSAFLQACNQKYLRLNTPQTSLASTPSIFGTNRKSNSMPDNTPPDYFYQKAFSGNR